MVPSPKSQVQDVGLPVEVSVNWTFKGLFPFTGLPPKEALGGVVDAGLMVKVSAPDVPPPGVGLKTATGTVPAVAISVDAIGAVSWVDET